MGNYKATHKNVNNQELPRIHTEPNYEVKTRPPINSNNNWRMNMLLRIREQQLSDEAMPLARRKCYDPVQDFAHCRKNQGFFWYVFNCQEEFHYVSECFERQFKVQMDKLRRNMKRNPEPWWHQFYSEQGQVGKQRQSPIEQQYDFVDSLKFTILGIQKQKDKN